MALFTALFFATLMTKSRPTGTYEKHPTPDPPSPSPGPFFPFRTPPPLACTGGVFVERITCRFVRLACRSEQHNGVCG